MQCVRLIVNGIQVVENCPQTVHILLVQPVEEHAADGHAAIVQDLDGGERVTVRRLHADEIDGAAAHQAAAAKKHTGRTTASTRNMLSNARRIPISLTR